MQHKRPPIPVIILLVVAVIIGGWFLIQTVRNDNNGAIKASGTIEAVVVNISPELAGKVAEVKFNEGETVMPGDVLFLLDDMLLQAQRRVAAAAFETAKAAANTAQVTLESVRTQYTLALDAARVEDQNSRIIDWFYSSPDYFDKPAWYFSRSEQTQAAQVEVEAARSALETASVELTKVEQSLEKAGFITVEKRLQEARIAYLVARDLNSRAQVSDQSGVYEGKLPFSLPPWMSKYRLRIQLGQETEADLVNAAQDIYDAAKIELDAAQVAYNDLLDSGQADDLLEARAVVSVEQERYEIAQDHLRMLELGSESPRVAAAQKSIEQAQAAVDQALKAVDQAEAQLNLVDVQLDKLRLQAPIKGVVLNRNIEPGEVVQPGTIAMSLARLEDLTITVYIPEDRYGEISLGQQAVVTVDSFPGVIFKATVVHISDQAEFTPRNVQTVEGRSTTVYAIKLSVDDTEGKLKPGMPADVVFGR